MSQFCVLMIWPASHCWAPIEPSELIRYAISCPDQSPLLNRAWYRLVPVPHDPVFSDTAEAAAVFDSMSTAIA